MFTPVPLQKELHSIKQMNFLLLLPQYSILFQSSSQQVKPDLNFSLIIFTLRHSIQQLRTGH